MPEIGISTKTNSDLYIEFEDHAQNRDNVWIDIQLPDGRPALSLNIIVTDEGIVLDLYPLDMEDGEPVASTYAFNQDIVDASEAVKP